MRIKEQTSSRIVVTRGSVFDRTFFSIFVVAGLGIFVFVDRIEQPVWPWLALAVLFVGAGGYFWMLSGDMTLTMDRRSGVAQIDWTQLRGRKRQTAPLEDIVEVRAHKGDDASRLELCLKDGATLPLTPYQYTGGDHPKVATAINTWLSEGAAQ